MNHLRGQRENRAVTETIETIIERVVRRVIKEELAALDPRRPIGTVIYQPGTATAEELAPRPVEPKDTRCKVFDAKGRRCNRQSPHSNRHRYVGGDFSQPLPEPEKFNPHVEEDYIEVSTPGGRRKHVIRAGDPIKIKGTRGDIFTFVKFTMNLDKASDDGTVHANSRKTGRMRAFKYYPGLVSWVNPASLGEPRKKVGAKK